MVNKGKSNATPMHAMDREQKVNWLLIVLGLFLAAGSMIFLLLGTFNTYNPFNPSVPSYTGLGTTMEIIVIVFGAFLVISGFVFKTGRVSN
jgi:hypothetical protein